MVATSHVFKISFACIDLLSVQRPGRACVTKGTVQRCLDPTLKIMFLPQSLPGTKERALNKALIAVTKNRPPKNWLYCKVSVIVLLLQVHKGLNSGV